MVFRLTFQAEAKPFSLYRKLCLSKAQETPREPVFQFFQDRLLESKSNQIIESNFSYRVKSGPKNLRYFQTTRDMNRIGRDIKTDSVQSSSNMCKNYLLKIYLQHGNFLNAIYVFSHPLNHT